MAGDEEAVPTTDVCTRTQDQGRRPRGVKRGHLVLCNAPVIFNVKTTALPQLDDAYTTEAKAAGSRGRQCLGAATARAAAVVVGVALLLLAAAALVTVLLRPRPPPAAALHDTASTDTTFTDTAFTDTASASTDTASTDTAPGQANHSCGSLEPLPCGGLENDSSTTECPQYYQPTQWEAKPPNKRVPMWQPIKYVVVSHTAQSRCNSLDTCSPLLRSMQAHHLKLRYDDIAYNFLVADDGSVYEARGWRRASSHLRTRGNITLGISYFGDYRRDHLTTRQVTSTAALLRHGVSCGYLDSDYLLVAHNQTRATKSPGTFVVQEIRGWPHYSDVLFY